MPAEYFHRPNADINWQGAFGAYELEQVVADLCGGVRPYRGWVHGFMSPSSGWLQNLRDASRLANGMRRLGREPKGSQSR